MKWTEDKMAMVSAIVLILISIFAYLVPSLWSSDQNLFQDIQNESTISAPFKTIEEYEMETSKIIKPKENFLLHILEMTKVKTQTWEINPLGAFQSKSNEAKLAKYQTLQDQVAAQLNAAKILEQSAQNLLFQDKEANKIAEEAIAKWQKGLKEAKKEKPKPVVGTFALIAGFLIGFLLLGIIFSFVLRSSEEGTTKFFVGFTFVFLIAMLAYVISSQAQLKDAGLGYALWSIALGIFLANFLSLPEWVKPGLKHELFIKTGLVLLGAEILFSKIL
ncbi:MAG TPA: putative sulfate exporter family transporter, partial [Saprospiraceae bacterium]|nr:putative sulfate exporter family transporter [Saprospiraceae bacterium]